MANRIKLVRQYLTSGSLLKVDFDTLLHVHDIISSEYKDKQIYSIKEVDGYTVIMDPVMEGEQVTPDNSDIFAGKEFLVIGSTGEYNITTEQKRKKKPVKEESLIETIVKDGKTIFKIKK